ncbi:MAG: signal peptidase II [Blautia sp.]|nr:signal peptidase II [Blautia sp.]
MSGENISKAKSRKALLLSAGCVAVAILLDQLTKFWATALKGQEPLVVIPDVFEFRYLENQSAAFSLDLLSILHRIFHFKYFDAHPNAFLTAKMVFFVVVTLLVVFFLIAAYCKIPWNRHFLPMNLVILGFLAGALGNMIDRITHRYVIDFFYFKLINFPVFNVADIYVTVAAFGLIFIILFVYKDEDFVMLFPPDKKRRKKR